MCPPRMIAVRWMTGTYGTLDRFQQQNCVADVNGISQPGERIY